MAEIRIAVDQYQQLQQRVDRLVHELRGRIGAKRARALKKLLTKIEQEATEENGKEIQPQG